MSSFKSTSLNQFPAFPTVTSNRHHVWTQPWKDRRLPIDEYGALAITFPLWKLTATILDCGIETMNPPHYAIVRFEQGSQEWLEWRHKGIGASDAPAVMGENLRDTAAELLRYKHGPAIDRFPNAAGGLLLEPLARERYTLKTGVKVEPACLQSTKHDWLRASVDGISADGEVVVEIKCGTSIYRKTSQLRALPGQYYAQLQHILAVTGLDMIDFWCCIPNRPGILLHVDRNPRYIELLLTKELEFWQQMQQR